MTQCCFLCYDSLMRVVSFVPSWTETLIEAQIEVVGRTRFCIHPEDTVKAISVVGGTKNINLDQVIALKPDLVIFDKEENNQEMYQLCVEQGLNCYATHVIDLKSCGEELLSLAKLLNNELLKTWGSEYLSFSTVPTTQFKKCIIEGEFETTANYTYVIWKKPFMRVSPNTFIADVLRLFDINLADSEIKYPEIADEDLKKTFCIFSSEPFPFAKYMSELKTQGYKGVLIDGEKISWYGIRTLKFLKSLELS
ncbi:Fe3+-siderophores ABC transporter protein [Bdellovibrio sp. qaytius]|nr:Fe3+-siderophores ABC transporter protein [Bdellovibrio sp. qaytius]